MKKAALAIISILMIGWCGCMGFGDINRGALAYMERKYGEKFEYLKPTGSMMPVNDTRKILVSCESLPGKEIVLVVINDEKGERYKDNYKDHYFEGQVRDFIIDIAKNYFDDVTFRVSISQLSTYPQDDPLTMFEDYMNEGYTIDGHMDIKETSEETVRKFVEELMRLGLYFSLGIDIPSIDAGYSADHFHNDTEYDFYRRH
jgi:hypothetical protein